MKSIAALDENHSGTTHETKTVSENTTMPSDMLGAYSIADFCHAHGNITRQHFHSLIKRGLGPRTFKVGKRTLISRQAASEWVCLLETKTAATREYV